MKKKVVVGVAGGISAYKAISVVSALTKQNIDVYILMTKNATKFVTPLTFQTLSKNKVIVDMFEEENIDYVSHIYFGQEVDLIAVVPATANIIGKVANGIADDMISSTIIAATVPVIFAPAMNEYMFKNKIVQDNILKLKKYNYKFIEPVEGFLACGTTGVGKLADTKTIVTTILDILNKEEK